MRILVTRPQPAATATAGRLAAMGHEPLVLPLMQAIHDPQAAAAALGRRHDALVLSSAEALRALAGIEDLLAAYRDIPVFCVGAATARAAAALGFSSIVTGPGTGEGLAARIAASAPAHRAGILYLAGNPRSPALETGLRRAGIGFETVECYRMAPLEGIDAQLRALLDTTPPQAVLLYSRESARLLFSLPAAVAMTGQRFLCLSPTIAEALPVATGTVAIAATPDEDSLLSLL